MQCIIKTFGVSPGQSERGNKESPASSCKVRRPRNTQLLMAMQLTPGTSLPLVFWKVFEVSCWPDRLVYGPRRWISIFISPILLNPIREYSRCGKNIIWQHANLRLLYMYQILFVVAEVSSGIVSQVYSVTLCVYSNYIHWVASVHCSCCKAHVCSLIRISHNIH